MGWFEPIHESFSLLDVMLLLALNRQGFKHTLKVCCKAFARACCPILLLRGDLHINAVYVDQYCMTGNARSIQSRHLVIWLKCMLQAIASFTSQHWHIWLTCPPTQHTPLQSLRLVGGGTNDSAIHFTGAEELIHLICNAGIPICLANPGTTEMHIVDALFEIGRVKTVLGLHENVVTGAADGYARMARRPAMTLLHLGPGLANGLAGLQSAICASSPILNVIGVMATWHDAADAPLKMDVKGLAQTVSCWTGLPPSPDLLNVFAQEAIDRVRASTRPGGSRIVTLLLPHEMQWKLCSQGGFDALPPSSTASCNDKGNASIQALLHDLVEAGPRGALFLGRESLCQPLLSGFASYAIHAGSEILCASAIARVDRGQGRPAVKRIPQLAQQTRELLKSFTVIVFIDAVEHADSVSSLMSSHTKIHHLPHSELSAAYNHLLGNLPQNVEHATVEMPPLIDPFMASPPSGPLTDARVCQIVAMLQPLDAIIIEEFPSFTDAYWQASERSPPFSHLMLTGGSCGQGSQCAVGAALACPSRRVINLQAEGSVLHASQALWTQARERLSITTIVRNKNTYGILQVELSRRKAKLGRGGDIVNAPNQLDDPTFDWISLAAGYGVLAVTVRTCAELSHELSTAITAEGPRIIVASSRTAPSTAVHGDRESVRSPITSAPCALVRLGAANFDINPWFILEATAERQPTHVALMQETGVILSYGEVSSMALHLAASLRERGIQVGERIGTLSANCWQLIPLHYAAAALRCAILNINTRLAAQVRTLDLILSPPDCTS